MNRQDIEQLNIVRPFCFETEREEEWYNAGLIDGLEVADNEDPWISVDERMPETDPETLKSATVFVRAKGKYFESFYVAKYSKHFQDWISDSFAVMNVTHWMPIPSLKGGKE